MGTFVNVLSMCTLVQVLPSFLTIQTVMMSWRGGSRSWFWSWFLGSQSQEKRKWSLNPGIHMIMGYIIKLGVVSHHSLKVQLLDLPVWLLSVLSCPQTVDVNVEERKAGKLLFKEKFKNPLLTKNFMLCTVTWMMQQKPSYCQSLTNKICFNTKRRNVLDTYWW